MPVVDDFPFHAAATLAIDLVKARPKLDESKAAIIAWQTFKRPEKPGPQARFQSTQYIAEVMRAIGDIRSGRRERVERSPAILEDALKQVDREQSK